MVNTKIELENLEFHAYHGCYDVEHVVGNDYRVDVELFYDASEAVAHDDVNYALNYQLAYQIVAHEMGIEAHLLECVCDRILRSLYERFDMLTYAKIKIAKLNPPLGGKIGATSVSMECKRDDIVG